MSGGYEEGSGLAARLFEDYYGEDASKSQGEEISSWWEKYLKNLKVQLGKDGQVEELSGFSKRRHGSIISRLLDNTWFWIHAIKLARCCQKTRHIKKIATELCPRMGLDVTYNVMVQIFILSFLMRNGPQSVMDRKHKKILIIGDGHGVLAALFKELFPDSKIVLVDLGKVLLFQAHHLQTAFPKANHTHVDTLDEGKHTDFVYCPAELLDAAGNRDYDIAINNVSMQEMRNVMIQRYFRFLRSNLVADNVFYCCNRERKRLPDGEETRILEYPWDSSDFMFADERCPWMNYVFNLGISKNLKLLGLPLPLVERHDGPTRHRLTRMQVIGHG